MERAFVAEDDVFAYQAIRRALFPDFTVTRAADAREARRVLRRDVEYTLFVFDIHLPGALPGPLEGGLQLFEQIRKRAPRATLIIMSGDVTPRFVNYGLPHATFVAKPFARATLRAIAEKAIKVPASDGALVERATALTSCWKLSLKERQLLACHLDAKTTKETCAALGIRARTHESHVRNILAKAARAGERFDRFWNLVTLIRSAR